MNIARIGAGFALVALVACASGRGAILIPVPAPTQPLPQLLQDLASAEGRTRAAAAWELAGVSSEQRVVVRAAVEPLRVDPDQSVRYAAAWALAHLRTPSESPTPAAILPKLVLKTSPQYPSDAFAARVEGTVLLELLIGEQGEVAHVEVRRSTPKLDKAAMDCVRQWRFEPMRVGGVPRASMAQSPVTFRIY